MDAPVTLLGDGHYGAIPSPHDERDHELGAYASINPAAQPASFYPNLDGVPVWMQHKLGACVGHAAGKSQQVAEYHETGAIPAISARFLYAMAKCLDGYSWEGTSPRLVASIMKNFGCATEATVPNDTTLDHEAYVYGRKQSNIPVLAFDEAQKIKISNYAFAQPTEAQIKAAIQFAGEHRGGVFMLVRLDKNWWTRADGVGSWAAADILPLRHPTDEATTGGHEIYPYAFDERDGRTIVIFRNSWSEAWGDKGDGWFFLDEWMPYIVEIVTTVDLDDSYVAPNWTYHFTKQMRKGDTNSEVLALQHALRIDGDFHYPTLTGFYGAVTEGAVMDFQTKYKDEILTPIGLTHPTGIVGPQTLKKLNALFAPK